MINGRSVKLGDRVYVLSEGWAEVTAVDNTGGFRAATQHSERFYTHEGFLGNRRVVFWNSPFTIEPHPDKDLWKAYTEMAKSMYIQLVKLHNLGALVYELDVEETK